MKVVIKNVENGWHITLSDYSYKNKEFVARSWRGVLEILNEWTPVGEEECQTKAMTEEAHLKDM